MGMIKRNDLDKEFDLFLEKSGIYLYKWQKELAMKILRNGPIDYIPYAMRRGNIMTSSLFITRLACNGFIDEINNRKGDLQNDI